MGMAGIFLIIAFSVGIGGFILSCATCDYNRTKFLKKYNLSSSWDPHYSVGCNDTIMKEICAKAGILTEYNAAVKKDSDICGAVTCICAIIVTVSIITAFVFGNEDRGSGYASVSYSSSSRTCPICGRSFSEGSSDYSNIGYAGMCDNCERNYHLANGD